MRRTFKLLLLCFVLLLISVSIFAYERTTRTTDTSNNGLAITQEEAQEIARNHIGHGTVENVTMLDQNEVLLYVVEIEHENVRYVVDIHSETGDVMGMSRYEEGYEGITTLPEILPPGELEIDSE